MLAPSLPSEAALKDPARLRPDQIYKRASFCENQYFLAAGHFHIWVASTRSVTAATVRPAVEEALERLFSRPSSARPGVPAAAMLKMMKNEPRQPKPIYEGFSALSGTYKVKWNKVAHFTYKNSTTRNAPTLEQAKVNAEVRAAAFREAQRIAGVAQWALRSNEAKGRARALEERKAPGRAARTVAAAQAFAAASAHAAKAAHDAALAATAAPPKPPVYRRAPAPPVEEEEEPFEAEKSTLKEGLSRMMAKVIDHFRSWDENGDGLIGVDEFRRAVRAAGLVFDDAVCDAVFAEYDEDGSGAIDFREYVRLSLRDVLARQHQRVMDLFQSWDEDGSGTIDKKEFRQAIGALGFDAPTEELDAAFDAMDDDGSGVLDFREVHRQLRQGAGIKLAAELRDGAAGEIAVEARNKLALRKGGRPYSAGPSVAAAGWHRWAALADDAAAEGGADATRGPTPSPGEVTGGAAANERPESGGEPTAAGRKRPASAPALRHPAAGARPAAAPTRRNLADEMRLAKAAAKGGAKGGAEAEPKTAWGEAEDYRSMLEAPAGGWAAQAEPGPRQKARYVACSSLTPAGAAMSAPPQKALPSFGATRALVEVRLRKTLDVNKWRVIDLFQQLDVNGDGMISRTEWMNGLLTLNIIPPSGKAAALDIFASWDTDHSGTIDFKELNTRLRYGGEHDAARLRKPNPAQRNTKPAPPVRPPAAWASAAAQLMPDGSIAPHRTAPPPPPASAAAPAAPAHRSAPALADDGGGAPLAAAPSGRPTLADLMVVPDTADVASGLAVTPSRPVTARARAGPIHWAKEDVVHSPPRRPCHSRPPPQTTLRERVIADVSASAGSRKPVGRGDVHGFYNKAA